MDRMMPKSGDAAARKPVVESDSRYTPQAKQSPVTAFKGHYGGCDDVGIGIIVYALYAPYLSRRHVNNVYLCTCLSTGTMRCTFIQVRWRNYGYHELYIL